jgi:hypothetical protein
MSAYEVGLRYYRLGGCGLASCESAQVFVPTSYDNSKEYLGPVTIVIFLSSLLTANFPRSTVILEHFGYFVQTEIRLQNIENL